MNLRKCLPVKKMRARLPCNSNSAQSGLIEVYLHANSTARELVTETVKVHIIILLITIILYRFRAGNLQLYP